MRANLHNGFLKAAESIVFETKKSSKHHVSLRALTGFLYEVEFEFVFSQTGFMLFALKT
jgi:hypothetical protein